ncbi:Uncharacterised protein [Serratia fonticola]|nr:Uncharacterised protein [Serratia fonticola]
MTKNRTPLLVVLTMAVLLIPELASARTLAFPTTWEIVSVHSAYRTIRPVSVSATVPFDVPDNIANRYMYSPPDWGANMSGIYVADVAYAPWPHSQGILGNRGNTVWSAWGRLDSVHGNAHATIDPTCLKWGVASFTYNWQGGYDKKLIFELPCFPITLLDPNTCSISTTDVTLDHGTITLGRPSRAAASFDISCKKSGSGRILLASGSENVPIGGGFATLSTDRGPLSTSLFFPEGSSTIQLVSTLTDVQSGVWSASTVITLDMD